MQLRYRQCRPFRIPVAETRVERLQRLPDCPQGALRVRYFFLQVVCLLSSNRKDKYDAIKKYLCTDCPTPSQCVLARTLSKPQTVMAIATKIALQMNCKMGGELWSVEIPVSSVALFQTPPPHFNT